MEFQAAAANSLNPLRILALGAACLLLTACGDSHERLAQDRIRTLDEMSGLFESVTAGENPTQATKRLKGLEDRIARFAEREKKLGPADPKTAARISQEYDPQVKKAFIRFSASALELQASKRATPELREAAERAAGLR